MTEADYRALIQKFVDRARREQFIAERARRRGPAELRDDDRRGDGDGVLAPGRWTTEEQERRALLEQGMAVAVRREAAELDARA